MISFRDINQSASDLTGLAVNYEADIILNRLVLPPLQLLGDCLCKLKAEDSHQPLRIASELNRAFRQQSPDNPFKCQITQKHADNVDVIFSRANDRNFSLNELHAALMGCKKFMPVYGDKLAHQASSAPLWSQMIQGTKAQKLKIELSNHFGAENILAVSSNPRQVTVTFSESFDISQLYGLISKKYIHPVEMHIAGSERRLVKIDTVGLNKIVKPDSPASQYQRW